MVIVMYLVKCRLLKRYSRFRVLKTPSMKAKNGRISSEKEKLINRNATLYVINYKNAKYQGLMTSIRNVKVHFSINM